MNNTSRTLLFIVLSSIVMMAAITLQNRFFPPKPPVVKNVEEVVDGDADVESDATGQQQSEDNSDAQPADGSGDDPNLPRTEETPGEADQEADNSESPTGEPIQEPPANAADDNPNKQQAEGDTKQAEGDATPPTDEDAVESKHPERLVTLGSLAPAAGYRFLCTLNSRGGTIRRLESASRKPNGKYVFRDLEQKTGYLGELDCSDTPDGCQVGVVGAGTPAELAGIQAGDIIRSVNGEPVVSAADFLKILTDRKMRPEREVEIEFSRKSESGNVEVQTVAVTLTDKPMEFLQPENSVVSGNPLPESFLFTLHQANDSNWVESPELREGLRNGNWEVKELEKDGQRVVEFHYEIPREQLQAIGLDGPLLIIKRYWLETFEASELADQSGRSWHLNLELEIQCRAESAVAVGYQLDGPTGASTEGWWYQIKINGSGSFTGMAGARDVVGETLDGHYSFLAGPGLVANLKKDPARQDNRKHYLFEQFSEESRRQVKYMGVDSQYFNVSMLPDSTLEQPYVVESGMGWPTDVEFPKETKMHRLVDCTGVLLKKVALKPNSFYLQKFEIFAGPKEANLLEEYGLDKTRAFGWFGLFSKPLCWLLRVLYGLTFQISYAIPIILLTVIVRCLMIPVSRKAALNAQMMQYLSPQMKAIKEKYPEDMQAQATAQRELFKKHNYNPLSGCLMGFIQLPIFIGLYRGLSVDIALRDQPLIPGLNWCSNLAAPDQLLRWDSWMPAFLASETGWLGPYLNILPLVTIVLFVTNAKLFTPPPTDEQQAMMQKMMTYMMFFMGFLFFKVPAALCLYFITSSIWGIAERKLLPKPQLDTSKLDGEETGAEKVQKSEPAQPLSNTKAIEERKKRDRERKKRLRER